MPAHRLRPRVVALLAAAGAAAPVLAAGAAHAASRTPPPTYVTARYSGTWDESFVYDPSDPATWQESMHFAWDEQAVAQAGRPYPASPRVLSRTLTIGGSKRSTYAPPNAFKDCSATFSVKPHHKWPLAILSGPGPKAGVLHLNVSAIAPLDLTEFAATSGTGDCATIRTPASPPTSSWQAALTPLADFRSTRHRYERSFDTTDGSLAQGGTIVVHATLVATTSHTRPQAGCSARTCAVCPNPSDDAVRAAFERAQQGDGGFVDQLPKLSGFHAARVKLLAAINAVRPRTEAVELQALHDHEGAYEARIRKVHDGQAAKLAADERHWLARARCPATRRAIEQGFVAPRENLESSYRRARSYVDYLTHAIKQQCGCGGVKHALPAAAAAAQERSSTGVGAWIRRPSPWGTIAVPTAKNSIT